MKTSTDVLVEAIKEAEDRGRRQGFMEALDKVGLLIIQPFPKSDKDIIALVADAKAEANRRWPRKEEPVELAAND